MRTGFALPIIGLMVVLVAACQASGSPATPPSSLTPAPSPGTVTARPTSTPGSLPSAAVTASVSQAPVATATERPPQVLPGEPWLVFAWYPDTLYLVRPDGTDRHPIDIGVDGIPFAPSWSPDGEQIAFVMRTDDAGSVWTAAADGSGAGLLYDSEQCTQSFWPVWSPDGTRIAIACYVERDGDVFSSVSILDLASMERTDFVTLKYPETFDNPPSWSPDGSALTFEIIKWDPTDQFVESSVIATIPATGGRVRRLTEPLLMAGHPDWGPDGSLIAFNTYDTGNIHGITEPSNVYTMEPDGSHLTQLSTTSVDGTLRLGQPFWSPDGRRIWVSVARDYERDGDGQAKNTLGWVDATTGAFTELGTDGKRFRERPTP